MLAEALMTYAEAQSFGTVGTDMGVGYQPDSVDRFIAFYDESAPVIDDSDAFSVDNSGVQIIVRSKDYADARDTLHLIHKAIVAFSGDLGDGTTVTQITVAQNPAWIGRDTRERHEWTAHYELRFLTTGDAFRVA